MTQFTIGTVELSLKVVGVGVRNGTFPSLTPFAWGLTLNETTDLVAFQEAGWNFRPGEDTNWQSLERDNAGEIEAGLLAQHPSGGLVIITDRLVVSAPSSADWVPSGPNVKRVTRAPIAKNVFDVQLKLPESGLLNLIVGQLASFRTDLDGSVNAEPLLTYHLTNPGDRGSITTHPIVQWHWDKIHIDDAWALGSKGRRVSADPALSVATRVGILDFGFYPMEPQLTSNIAWRGYVDDHVKVSVNGYAPHRAHGTFCAGLVAALLADKKQNYGAAPETNLILVAVQSVTNALAVATALRLCAFGCGTLPGADIISASIGLTSAPWELSNDLHVAIDSVLKNGRGSLGVPIVWADFDADAAIDSGSLEAYGPIICVGQSDMNDARASCGYGSTLDLLAPGSGVYGIDWNANGSATGQEFGCSVAAPIVAAVGALVLSHRWDLTYDQVAEALTKSCQKAKGQTACHDDRNGWGRLDARAAIALAKTMPQKPPTPSPPA